MNLANLLNNYEEAVAMILFGIGFSNLLLQKNLIKKIIGHGNLFVSCTKGICIRKEGTDRCRRGAECGSLHQSDSERAGAHRNCRFGFCDSTDAFTYDPAIPPLSYAGSG